jgi:hypothetical protein
MRLRGLRSILKVPDNQDLPIRLLHPSFRGSILDKERCSDLLFREDEKIGHQHLAICRLKRLTSRSTGLKSDICNIQQPGMLAAEVDVSILTQYLPPELQYACEYWVQHPQRSEQHLDDDGPIHIFLRQHFLYWLEALGWTGKTAQGVRTIGILEAMVMP